DSERLQRVVDLRRDRVGARPRLRARLAQLLAVRGAPHPGCGADGDARAPGAGPPRAEGPLPARQPARLQPQVLPALGAALRRLRAEARPTSCRHRRARSRGVPAVPERTALTVALGLVLALASAFALNWGWLAQHGAARDLPALSLRRPLGSLRLLFGDRAWLTGFVVGLAGWALYVAALALAPLSLVQGTSAGGVGLLAALAHRRR